MRWGLRCHPRKTKQWVLEHYWKRPASRWEFCTNVLNKEGDKYSMNLHKLADTKIVRHLKIKGEYNPFDPDWDVYGEDLSRKRMSQDLWDKERLKLWTHQDGNCALCQCLIDSVALMDDHHIVHKRHGGNNALSNRVLVHPVCHRRVHAMGLEVTKPVPVQGL